MRVVILAGGKGIRMHEETEFLPKALIEIGNIPIICHLMDVFSHYGFNDFILCLGYKGYQIKEYFLNYYNHNFDMTIDLEHKICVNRYAFDQKKPWTITLVETGENTETGGRLKRIMPYIDKEMFMMTYCDGLANVNLKALVDFHKMHGKLATVLSPVTPSKFGLLNFDKNYLVTEFGEKIPDNAFINGGFFVLDYGIFDYIDGDKTSWEYDSLPKLVKSKELVACKFDGFWKCMDSMKDKNELTELWNKNEAPWKL